jgi:hypothetical protein
LLWNNPVAFVEAMTRTANFKGSIKIPNLYFGDRITNMTVPWSYNFVWIGITTPLIYLILFVIGIGSLIIKTVKDRMFLVKSSYESFVLAWLFVPIVATILLKTFLYEGYRHLFFIYPGLIFIALIGFNDLYVYLRRHASIYAYIFGGIVATMVVLVAANMIKTHPFGNVYFNELAPQMTEFHEGFDKDYWGISGKQSLEYILKNDASSLIKVCGKAQHIPLLPANQRKRVSFVKCSEADYEITNYRGKDYYQSFNLSKAWHVIRVNGMPIIAIIKLKPSV